MDCLTRDDAGKPVLIYTDSKNNRPNRRLPIAEATAQIIITQQTEVRERFPDTDTRRLGAVSEGPAEPPGNQACIRTGLGKLHRDFIDSIADKLVTTMRGPDGVERRERFYDAPSSRIPTGTVTRNGMLTKALRQMCCGT